MNLYDREMKILRDDNGEACLQPDDCHTEVGVPLNKWLSEECMLSVSNPMADLLRYAKQINKRIELAKEALMSYMYESGDTNCTELRHTPYVVTNYEVDPDNMSYGNCTLLFFFKQESNGTTFVVIR